MKIWEPKPPGTLWATPGLLTGLLYIFYFCVRQLGPGFLPIPSHCDSIQFCNNPITAYPSYLLSSVLRLHLSIDALRLNTVGVKVLIQEFAK